MSPSHRVGGIIKGNTIKSQFDDPEEVGWDGLDTLNEKNDDWVKRFMTWKVEGIRQSRRPEKTWLDCVKNDMESLACPKSIHTSGINGEGELKGQPAGLTQIHRDNGH